MHYINVLNKLLQLAGVSADIKLIVIEKIKVIIKLSLNIVVFKYHKKISK